jgi:hypothetical protein
MNKEHAHNWIDRTGEINTNKFGTKMKIVKYNSRNDVIIEFQDEHKLQKSVCYKSFVSGSVRNPYDKTFYGEGFFGEGAFSQIDKQKVRAHGVWRDIIRRCYSNENKRTHLPYKNCAVSEEWKNYSNFYKWYEDNFYECSDQLEVDKDILSKEEKIYSKETCLLIPREINGFCKPSKQGGCYLTVCNKWSANVNRRSGYTHIGNFDNFEEAEIEFIKCKNSIFQSLVDKYKGELPKYVYKKLKNAKLRR